MTELSVSPILFLQSADRDLYAPMLQASAQTVLVYCRQHGCDYESFLGLKRGTKPWHAALNRITIIHRYVGEGYRGWIVWMDADSYIADLNFDLRAYLAGHSHYAMIAAPGGAPPHVWWNINNGVFAINLGHPIGRTVATRWYDNLMAVSDAALADEPCWSAVIDDQDLLHAALKDSEGADTALLQDGETFNWDAKFIRQVIRAVGSVEYRERRLRQVAADLLGDQGSSQQAGISAVEAHRDFAHALYHVLLGRDPDPVGLSTLVGNLTRNERTYKQEMEACMRSTEFERHSPALLRSCLTDDGAVWLGRQLAGLGES